MLRNCYHAPSFDEAHQEIDPAGRSARRSASSSRPIATTLRTICDALREGLAAHRQYEHLKSRGVSHDRALREALGIHIPASEVHAAARYRYYPLPGTARNNETVVPCKQCPSGSVDPAPRLRASARVGNLAYVK